jgi:hypothetical protein
MNSEGWTAEDAARHSRTARQTWSWTSHRETGSGVELDEPDLDPTRACATGCGRDLPVQESDNWVPPVVQGNTPFRQCDARRHGPDLVPERVAPVLAVGQPVRRIVDVEPVAFEKEERNREYFASKLTSSTHWLYEAASG